ncbi:Ig-like domain-containing protein [Candidatus Gracilibacteria bacterium]|nr:Ig-like domain-containing protein [Candidatus Gracilibacteria bacterium]
MATSSSRKWIVLVSVLVGLVVIAGGSVAAYTYLLAPPIVLGDELALGQVQKIDINAPIKIPFSRAMDRVSVENAFHISPAVSGKFHWEDNTLIYTPEQSQLKNKQQYRVWIDATAQDMFRKKLQTPFYQQFETAGPIQVLMTLPKDQSDSIDTPVTVVFDRPMVPVTTLAGSENLGLPLQFTPSLAGTYKWLGSNTVQFTPTNIREATTYSVTVPKGITDLYGNALASDVTWQFDTPHPQILYTFPGNQFEKAGPNTEVVVRFNQAVDQISLEQNIQWQVKDKAEKVPFTARLEENGKKAILTPNQPLAWATTFEVLVKKEVKSAEGTKTLDAPLEWTFVTVGKPVVGATVPTERAIVPASYGVQINFSNPMKNEGVEQWVTIEPKVENLYIDFNQYTSDVVMNISGRFLPSTKYKVTLSKEWPDQFNQKLGTDFVLNFETEQTTPDLAFVGRQRFGLLDGYHQPLTQALQLINVRQARVALSQLSRDQIWAYFSNQYGNTYVAVTPGRSLGSWTVDSPSPLNQVVKLPVPLSGKVTTSGVYVMDISSPETAQRSSQVFAVSKTALTLKTTPTQVMVWATDLKSGLPVSDMSIETLAAGKVIATGKTDASGLVTMPVKVFADNLYEPVLVIGTKGDDIAIAGNTYEWSQGISAWQFNISEGWLENMRSYLHTDRPLYTPGQDVFIKAILRQEKDHRYQLLPTGTKVETKVTDANGDEIYSRELSTDAMSTISDTLTLASTAPVGQYYVNIRVNNESSSVGFMVQEFKKPLFKLELTPSHKDYLQGDTATVTLDAQYFFGAALSQATVNYRVTADDYYFSRYQDGYYNFGDYSGQCFYCDASGQTGKSWTEGEGKTDANGKLTFSIPTAFTDQKESQLLYVDVEVEDPTTHQVVTTSTQFIVHKADVYVGITNESYLAQAGEKMSFPIITTTIQGDPLPNISGSVALYRREYQSIRKKGVDGFFYYDTSFKDTEIKKNSFTTGADGKTVASFTATDGGEYHIVATVKDYKQHESKAATDISVATQQYINWGRDNNNRMEIIPDQKSYVVGDTAKLILKSPFAGVKALMTVERNDIIESKIIDIPSTATTIDLPLKDLYLPNVFVSITAVKGHGNDNVPAFRQGYINLRIDNLPRSLKVTLQPNKTVYAPKDTVQLDVTVTDQTGKPVAGDFALSVVDESLLALTGEKPDDILERFFGQRSILVKTFASLVTLNEQIDVKTGGGAKGGDGSGRALRRGNFKDTAYFNAHVVTDANGKAVVNFVLPDNITTWQMWLVGADASTNVGSQTIHVVSQKQVFAEPLLPRFVIQGDDLSLGAVIHNLNATGISAKVTLKSDQLTIATSEQSVSVANAGKAPLYWTTKIPEGIDQVTLVYTVDAGQWQDEVVKVIPVYPWWSKQTVAFGGMLNDKVLEEIVLPAGTIKQNGALKLTVSNNLFTDQSNILPVKSPADLWDDTNDQSSVLVIASLTSALSKMTNQDASNVWTNNVRQSLQSLYSMQRGDGGWGYGRYDIVSDPYLSAGVYDALMQVQLKLPAYKIDSRVVEDLYRYLTAYYNTELPTVDMTDISELGRKMFQSQTRDELDVRSYIAYVLTKYSAQNPISLQLVIDRQGALSVWGQAYLGLTAHALGRSDVVSAVKTRLSNNILVGNNQAHIEDVDYSYSIWNSPLRTNMAVAMFWLQSGGDELTLTNLMRYTIRSRQSGTFGALSEGVDWLRLSEMYATVKGIGSLNTAVAVSVNEKSIATSNVKSGEQTTSTSLSDFDTDGGINTLTLSRTGDGNLFYEGNVSYQVAGVNASAVTQGIGLYRQYSDLDDRSNKAITTAKPGQDIRVQVTVIVPEDRHHVILEDLLPAGMEAYNLELNQLSSEQQELLRLADETTLNTSAIADQGNWYDKRASFNVWSMPEIRNDKVTAYASYLGKGIYHFSYLARATLPGNYKVRPARVYQEFFPDIFASTEASEFVVRN